jgi:hypothetical protein
VSIRPRPARTGLSTRGMISRHGRQRWLPKAPPGLWRVPRSTRERSGVSPPFSRDV